MRLVGRMQVWRFLGLENTQTTEIIDDEQRTGTWHCFYPRVSAVDALSGENWHCAALILRETAL